MLLTLSTDLKHICQISAFLPVFPQQTLHWWLLVWLRWSFMKEGTSATSVLFQPRDRSYFSFICPLGLQRSPLIISVIEDWHTSVQCQAAKNNSNWLLASVIGWLVAMACLTATTLRRADRAALGWWSALNFTTMALSCYLLIPSLVLAQVKGF